MSPPLIPSKFFLAPINTGFAEHGRPTPKLLEFHRQRSGNGIGVSYVGNVAVDPRYVTNSSTLYLGDDLGSWVELAGTIRERGSLPALQLACRLPGRVARRTWTVPNKAEYVAHCQAVLRTLDVSDFERVIEMFARAATASARAGFEIIQVHAAHGYFLSQLLSPTVCPADLAVEPLPFVLRLLAVVAESAPSALIDIRISILEGLHTGEREAKETIVRQLQLGRVDLISISNGLYEVERHLIYPNEKEGHGVHLPMAIDYAQRFPSKSWNAAGNIWDLSLLPALPANLTISIGRSLIADPEFVEKSLRNEPPRACDRNGKCHYYTRGLASIECPVSRDLSPPPVFAIT